MNERILTITVYDDTVGQDALDEAELLYREVYNEPPYRESEDDFVGFADDLPRRATQRSFRLVIARLGSDPCGFSMGHQLPPTTHWWEGAVSSIPDEVTAEHPGRTFAVIEIAVREAFRRRGLGRKLHAHLTADLVEQRTTLLVRPDAEPARIAYSRWKYRVVGQIRPAAKGPLYDALIRD